MNTCPRTTVIPFDRILIAQAIANSLKLLTEDTLIFASTMSLRFGDRWKNGIGPRI